MSDYFEPGEFARMKTKKVFADAVCCVLSWTETHKFPYKVSIMPDSEEEGMITTCRVRADQLRKFA